MALRKTTRNRFGKAGAHPQLAWESQLPLKPCISLQPLDFKGNCDSSDFLLDFCFVSRCSFNLLRKCGLLAHTSAAFLKNCCTEKLFICLRLVPSSQQYYPLTSQKNRHRNFFRFHDGFLSALSPLLIHIEETEPSRISCKMFIQRRPI